MPTKTTPPTGDSDNPGRPDALGFHATTTGPSSSNSDPFRPTNFDRVTGDVSFKSAETIGLYTHIPHSQWATTVSMSDTSIVHLPPCSSSRSARRRGTPSHSGNCQADCVPVSDPQSTGHSSSTSSQHTRPTPQSTSESLPMSCKGSSDGVGPPQSSTSASSGTSASGPGRSHGSNVGDSDDTGEEPLTTFRFEHREDDSGHHVVIGREGKLSRCEDEPIRTPGAIQGFGVLVVVQQNVEENKFLVRQVSENSTELLGLSPHYLFSLACFTDVLPDSQAAILWDSIQYLANPDEDSPSEDDSLRVFLLRGWGMPGSALLSDDPEEPQRRRAWSCWCAAHRPKIVAGTTSSGAQELIILEFELAHDVFNPLYPARSGKDVGLFSGLSSPGGSDSDPGTTHVDSASTLGPSSPSESSLMPLSVSGLSIQEKSRALPGLEGDDGWMPSAEDILESTTNYAKPLAALERIRKLNQVSGSFSGIKHGLTSHEGSLGSGFSSCSRHSRPHERDGPVGMMDVFAVMSQVNEQLGAATDLDMLLKVVVGLVKDLTQFHRVLVYKFDESWNGQTVAELVDWNRTHDLYRGLHFPASDIPAQARQLYAINKTRLLYDREQTTARLVVRSKDDLNIPLNMTHCYLRAMSPIHLKYLANMGVRSSMSVSIVAFGHLWGLVACHSYGLSGMRVSFLVRQMLRLMSDSISRNIERLSYAQQLLTHKLFTTITGGENQHPAQSYIASNADDLLGLFDADFGVLVIGEGAKILGPNEHGQEVLVIAEYLRLKHFGTIQVSQAITKDFPDLRLETSLEVIAGLLYLPLSQEGTDFIALLRKGQPRAVHWAGKPYKDYASGRLASLEPRTSFRVWSETVIGRCRVWTDQQVETAGVLVLIYGKFIEVWRSREREKERTTKLTNILLSNKGHEVRTPLNHIINCLELALNGKLDAETRENLSKSHAASKSLLFTINDLLDLTRIESGHEMTFNEPFDLPSVITEGTSLYKYEAQRKGLKFEVDLAADLPIVIGDLRKIRTVVANLTANALKYTQRGIITVSCHAFNEPHGQQIIVEIIVGDTGCGIPANKLENIFREFEQVESAQPKTNTAPGLGLGLAVVARSVGQLGGQLRANSKVDEGSRFSFLIPFTTRDESGQALIRHKENQQTSGTPVSPNPPSCSIQNSDLHVEHEYEAPDGRTVLPVSGNCVESALSVTPSPQVVRVDGNSVDTKPIPRPSSREEKTVYSRNREGAISLRGSPVRGSGAKLRILSVEDNEINRLILAKRLQLAGHTVVNTTNGKEAVETIEVDQAFDCVLMDVQMPILNGFEATQRIRQLEATRFPKSDRLAHLLNGVRIPILAVSASLLERQRGELEQIGIDGWFLKPIDFGRLSVILRGVTDPLQRLRDEYRAGGSWEIGGWLLRPSPPALSVPAAVQSIDRDCGDLPESENSGSTDTDTPHGM